MGTHSRTPTSNLCGSGHGGLFYGDCASTADGDCVDLGNNRQLQPDAAPPRQLFLCLCRRRGSEESADLRSFARTRSARSLKRVHCSCKRRVACCLHSGKPRNRSGIITSLTLYLGVAAIVVWNTVYLERAGQALRDSGKDIDENCCHTCRRWAGSISI